MTTDSLAALAAKDGSTYSPSITWYIRDELSALLRAHPADQALLALRYESGLSTSQAASHLGCTDKHLNRRWGSLYTRLSERIGITITPPDLTSSYRRDRSNRPKPE